MVAMQVTFFLFRTESGTRDFPVKLGLPLKGALGANGCREIAAPRTRHGDGSHGEVQKGSHRVFLRLVERSWRADLPMINAGRKLLSNRESIE